MEKHLHYRMYTVRNRMWCTFIRLFLYSIWTQQSSNLLNWNRKLFNMDSKLQCRLPKYIVCPLKTHCHFFHVASTIALIDKPFIFSKARHEPSSMILKEHYFTSYCSSAIVPLTKTTFSTVTLSFVIMKIWLDMQQPY